MRKLVCAKMYLLAVVFLLFPWGSLTLAQNETAVQNLRAFAKLYGYVKYFHPSDEANAVNWDAFAVYGAERVKGAESAAELESILESLFSPIAPTVQLFASAGGPPDPIDLVPDDTAGLALVAWQHQGVSFGTNATSSAYMSARLNRQNPIPAARQSFGNVLRSIDAAPYLGREVRLTAFVRADESGAGSNGHMWLRVDREGNRRGFFDNMGDRPIQSALWQQYEIVGEIADDATTIFFGALLAGEGTLWLDEFALQVKNEQGAWEDVAMENLGFEESDSAGNPVGWSARSRGYEYDLESEGAHRGERSLTIRSVADENQFFTGHLFEATPQPGEVIHKQLGAGLSALIPLALYSDTAGTIGNTDLAALEVLTGALDEVGIDSLTADNESIRLGDVVIAWNVFQHFYPYFDVIDTDWDAELTAALESALTDRTGEEFFLTMNKLVASLHDGHGNVYRTTSDGRAGLPLLVDWIEEKVVVTTIDGETDLLPGDIVETIDGQSAIRVLEDSEDFISGSPQWKRYRALRRLFSGEVGSELALTIRREDSVFETRLTRIPLRGPIVERTGQSIRELENNVYYVDLHQAPMADISARMTDIAAARGVVFDLRGYPNGNHGVLGHLLEANDTSNAWMRVPQRIYPDREDEVGSANMGWTIPATEPHITGEVVFLTDGQAISYAESFMSFVEHYRLAEIVGQPTAGANGNVNPFDLPGGFRVVWTGMKVVKHDGSLHHTVGILPTIPFERTVQGIREGRDELLDKALEVINDRTRLVP